MGRRFVTVDVFTDRRFGGNPMAVVLDAEGLDAAAMQAVAREFNLSETTFVLPPDDSQSVNVKNRVGLLEGAVITWTKQIKAVLKQDPEQALKDGQDPTPDVELTFWRHKANNLNAKI